LKSGDFLSTIVSSCQRFGEMSTRVNLWTYSAKAEPSPDE